jgi:hypothetical protein
MEARDDRRLVRVVRRKGWGEVEGYVTAVGRTYVAVHALDEMRFEGLHAIRIADVRALKKPRAEPVLAKRVLKSRGQWPPASPELLDLDDPRQLLFTAGSLCRVLGVFDEVRRPGVFFVGNIERIKRRWVDVWQISTEGRWGDDDMFSVKLSRLTRVSLWDPYADAITLVADSHEGNMWSPGKG